MATLFRSTPNTGISYHGENPVTAAPKVQPQTDANNTPGLVQLNGVYMPGDIDIKINGKKVLAISKILDAVNVGTTISVVERIAREPYEIDFEFNVWLNQKTTFPMDALEYIWDNVWIPDTVCKVVSTYLNRLGVSEVIIESISPKPKRGSYDLPCTIKCYENVQGQSLLITNNSLQSGTAG